MTKITNWICLSLTGLALTLGACNSTPDAEKDYTLKIVKMSPAPRDKFYKIVKVPKSIAPSNCEKNPASGDPACATKRSQN